MPAFDNRGREYRSEKESANHVLSEMDAAAAYLMRRSGVTKAKATAMILEADPSLYTRYKEAKRADFSS
jgi:hypothetical protein